MMGCDGEMSLDCRQSKRESAVCRSALNWGVGAGAARWHPEGGSGQSSNCPRPDDKDHDQDPSPLRRSRAAHPAALFGLGPNDLRNKTASAMLTWRSRRNVAICSLPEAKSTGDYQWSVLPFSSASLAALSAFRAAQNPTRRPQPIAPRPAPQLLAARKCSGAATPGKLSVRRFSVLAPVPLPTTSAPAEHSRAMARLSRCPFAARSPALRAAFSCPQRR